jgi:poly(beta-D-mannuronate) lyase
MIGAAQAGGRYNSFHSTANDRATLLTIGFSCPFFPPVMVLELLDPYADPQYSIVNADAAQKNALLLQSIDKFMVYIEQALDVSSGLPNPLTAQCAYQQFRNWAAAGALTAEPATFNREGILKRGQYIVGLNILALKFKAARYPIDDVILGWLRTLNHKNADYFLHATNRGNLYVWSGAAAALYAILDHDLILLRYQGQVWQDSIAAIHDDGTIATELARGSMALVYHMFSLSGTVVQKSARTALGYEESVADDARIALLADTIGRALCDPQVYGLPAHAIQQVPGDWAYREAFGFAPDLLDQDWWRCGRPAASLSDPTFGGNTEMSAAALRQVSP